MDNMLAVNNWCCCLGRRSKACYYSFFQLLVLDFFCSPANHIVIDVENVSSKAAADDVELHVCGCHFNGF